LEGVLAGGEALQSPVHARGPHEKAHGREAAQVHGKSKTKQNELQIKIELNEGLRDED